MFVEPQLNSSVIPLSQSIGIERMAEWPGLGNLILSLIQLRGVDGFYLSNVYTPTPGHP